MPRVTFLTTQNDNTYMYSFKRNYTLVSHPIIRELFQKEFGISDKNGHTPDFSIGRLSSGLRYSFSDYRHYVNKYRFLKDSGYFIEKKGKEQFGGLLTNQHVDYELSNMKTLVFEITENCNLKCKYCFYGDFYNQYDQRRNNNLPIEDAIAIIDYLSQKWLSKKNQSPEKEIFIGFYGGEPLMNFKFIYRVVKHISDLQIRTNLKFRFSMTTNGILLKKYMSYLVKNNFSLTISLDGNEYGNSYRVFPNEMPSFEIVKKNIHLLKDRYPEFYLSEVFINAVLHDRNKMLDVVSFIHEEFGKSVQGSEVNPLLMGDKFKYEGHNYNLNKETDAKCFLSSSESIHINMFLRNFSNFHFENYSNLASYNRPVKYAPTGTCIPFSKRMFVTAQGKILPCETIAHNFSLGSVKLGKVELDIESIVNKYNQEFIRLRNRCNNCFRMNFCTECLFLHIIKESNVLKCNKLNHNSHSILLAQYYSLFENYPKIYKTIWEETRYA